LAGDFIFGCFASASPREISVRVGFVQGCFFMDDCVESATCGEIVAWELMHTSFFGFVLLYEGMH
jgi:hypothetical protein